MEKISVNHVLLLFFAVAAFIPSLMADGDFGSDEAYWRKRGLLARQSILQAYRPDPFVVIHQLNNKTHEALAQHLTETVPEGNITTTRRSLRKYKGPCMATNPIDRCWRCRSDWDLNRKEYAKCAQGFGKNAMGGFQGPIYVVTDSSDNDMVNPKPGTLRHAVIQTGALWIIFSRSMNIRLNQELIMTSHKTIDGRSVTVRITNGAGITLQHVQNVIISNIKITDIKASNGGLIRDSLEHFGMRNGADGDGVSIFGSSNIWLDHLSMSGGSDGLIDAVMGSTAITVSNCHFVRHDKVILFGGRDIDTIDNKMQITLAFNHFGKYLVQRMPRIRQGFVHIVNNDYTHWRMYAIGGSHDATIVSQGNRYIAPDPLNCKLVTHRELGTSEYEWKKWTWVTDQDEFVNGAIFVPSGNQNGVQKYEAMDHIHPAAHGKQAGLLTRFSGHLSCKKRHSC